MSISKKSAINKQAKVSDVEIPDAVLPENKISGIYETVDISNKPFTHRESEPSYINSKAKI